jgi:1,4-dihydroxy-2-naphthoate octaprenyltransferase
MILLYTDAGVEKHLNLKEKNSYIIVLIQLIKNFILKLFLYFLLLLWVPTKLLKQFIMNQNKNSTKNYLKIISRFRKFLSLAVI